MAKANVANTLVVPTETTVFPYYDDFNEEKNFYRILFRPGYAVQARELTQLQTILQNQIERFGRHIFQNGSMVIGGEIFFSPTPYSTINLSPTYANSAIDVNSFLNKTIVDAATSNTIQFVVSKVEGATLTDPPVLHGNYISFQAFDDNQTFKIKDEEVYANTATENALSQSSFAGIRDSIFFYNGYFIKVPLQTTITGKYSNSPSCRVGLELDDSIITEQSDTSLLDPAQESFNYQAPGASRYKVDLVLTTRSLDSTDLSKFIELGLLEGGIVKKLINTPLYSEIEEVLARRTYDESGNYTVRPFTISLEENKIDPQNKITAVLSPGKGYVYGYEIETIAKTELDVDKGRSLKKVDAFDLNMNYGNYVIVDNLRGVFDTSVMDVFDIHCTTNVNFSNNQTYNSSKIGYGRIKDLEFYSGDVDVDARKYEFYLFDTNFINISSNIATVLDDRTIKLYNDVLFTTSNNSYDGAVLRVTSGPGAGYAYTIGTYDNVSRNITLTTPLIETPTNASGASIEFNFGNADAFVKQVPFTSGATSNASASINVLNKSGGRANGAAYVSETSLSSLLFPLPDTYIAYGANGITNTTYSYRKKFTTNFNAGISTAIQVETNENFLGTDSSSNVSSTVMNNFLIVCTDKKTSARANGDIIKPTVTITGTPEQAVFATGNTDPNDSFSAVVFAKVDFDAGVVPKQKTLHLMNDRTLSSDTPTTLLNSPTGSSANVYVSDGQVVITNPSRKIGVKESLFITDVSAIKIYDLNGQAIPAGGESIFELNDVTDRYELDTGQRENFYDHASVRLRPNYAACQGPLIVCCRYYEHSLVSSAGGGYFSVDSYQDLNTPIFENGVNLGDGYSIIPQFVRSNGQLVELRDCIDFRPTRENGTNTAPNYTLQGVKIPLPTTEFGLDYEYYLGRRDIIALDRSRQFLVIPGIPSKYPQDPSVPATAMVLYSLNVPPYTEYPSNVSVKFVDNKRYTMRDIGKIEKRVENLEYYVSLNTLEKKALDVTISDVDGFDRTKYGIFVDSFTSHVLGNPTLQDYKCAMNFTEGWLQNQSETVGVKMLANVVSSTGVAITKDKTILAYNERELISQKFATKFLPLAEFLYASFEGNILMSPDADIWHSTNKSPDIIYTDEGINTLTINNIYQSIVNVQKR